MIEVDKTYIISQKLSELLKLKSIPFKESDREFSILCPSCLKEGKYKLKLNVSKESYLYHCFRCGIKGSALTLPTILNELGLPEVQHLFIDIITDIKFLKQQNKTFYQIYTDINNELDNDINKNLYKKQIKTTIRNTINIYDECCDKNNISIKNLIKSYLQVGRNIEPYQLKLHKITHMYGTDSKLNCRFVLPTYLYTNYEARAITNTINRYMKEDKNRNNNNLLFFDFVFINLINGIQYNPFKNKKELVLPYVIVTEGLFDALKLGLMNFPTISSGGVLYNKIKIIKLPMDKDICDLRGQINEYYYEIK